jgi:hypothetical protein
MAIFYVARTSRKKKERTATGLSVALFMIYAFIPQIDTLLYKNVFILLNKMDIVLLILANGIPVVLASVLGVYLFGNEYKPSRYIRKPKRFTTQELIVKLLLIGLLYEIIYFVFTHFVSWQIEEFRIFYTGKNQYPGFNTRLIDNWNYAPQIYFVQLIKGILFGLSILPIVNIFKRKSQYLLISIALIFESMAMYWIVPNLLFPDAVRIGHLLGLSGSMLVFSFITWFIFSKMKISNS